MKSDPPNPFLKIVGKYNYYLQANIKGSIPYQSSTLIISAYTNESKKVSLEFTTKYYRVKQKTIVPLVGINSNVYNLSSSDIGCTIKVEISPSNNQRIYSGVVEIIYGPIQMEPTLKYTLENILSIGGSKFPIKIISEERKKDTFHEDSSLLLTNDNIRMILGGGDQEKSVKFKYYLGQPQVILNNNDPTQIQLLFKGEDEYEIVRAFFNRQKNNNNTFDLILQTVSRNSRDLIILALRSFSVKNYLINSKVLSYIGTLFEETENKVEKAKLDLKSELILEIESIKKEVYSLANSNKDLNNEKSSLIKEIKALEEELDKTIQMYTNLIKDMKLGNPNLNESILDISMLGKKEEMEFRKKYKIMEQENKTLITKNKALTNQLDLLQNFNKNKGFFDETQIFQETQDENFDNKKKIQELENIISDLRNNLEEIKQKGVDNILEKKFNDSKKLNALLLEEIAVFKLKSDTMEKNLNKNRNIDEMSQLQNLLKEKVSENISSQAKYDALLLELQNNKVGYENKINQLERNLKENYQKNEGLQLELDEVKSKGNFYNNKDYNYGPNRFDKHKYNENKLALLEKTLQESKEKNSLLTQELDELNSKINKFDNCSEKTKANNNNSINIDNLNSLKQEIDQLKKHLPPYRNFDQPNRIIFDDFGAKINNLLEIELKHLKLELQYSYDKALKFEQNLAKAEILFYEERQRNDLVNSGLNNNKNNLETLKIENQYFQNENTNLLEERNKKMEKILALESEIRSLKSNLLNKNDLNGNNKNDFEVKELKNKNLDFIKEIGLLRNENCVLKSKLEKLKDSNEQNEKLTAENIIIKNEIEDCGFQIEDLQFKVNSLTNELQVEKINHIGKASLIKENNDSYNDRNINYSNINKYNNDSNYKIYNNNCNGFESDPKSEEIRLLTDELEKCKFSKSEQQLIINQLTETINTLKNNTINDEIQNYDIKAQEIIETLQNEKKALLNKTESIQKELFKLQKDKGYNMGGYDNGENIALRKKVMDLEMEIQLLLGDRKNVFNQNKNKVLRHPRGIFS